MDVLTQPASQSTSRYSRRVRAFATIAFTALAGWLLSPLLSATHVEAFSARLQTMAIMMQRGQFLLDDAAYPIDIEYFYTTRGATVHALAWLMKITHSTGDINFRILILLSFAVFVVSCVRFVRTWTDEPIWAAMVVLVLTPGLVEISFFFADNLPSAAMVTLGMAMIGRRSGIWRWGLAGMALACGVLLRTDAVAAVPSIALLAFLGVEVKWRRIVTQWAAALLGSVAIFALWWKATGVSLRHMLLIGRLYGAIHNSWGDRMAPQRVIILFFGPTVLLIALAVYRRWRGTNRLWKLVMIGWPVLFYVVFMTRTAELRDYLLLGAPFVLLHGAIGLTEFLSMLEAEKPRVRFIAWSAAALYGLTLIAPPMLLLHDGPRFALGRIYSPSMWRRWQRTTEDSVSRLTSMADSTPQGDSLLVLTVLFQSDRYLHLALLENGYAMSPLRADPACGGVEVYTKDGRTIYHIRTENPYILFSTREFKMPPEYVRGFQIESGIDCVRRAGYDRAVMVTWGRMWEGYMADTPEFVDAPGPLEVPFPQYGTPRIGLYKFLGVQRIIPLSREQVADLQAKAQQVTASFEAGNHGDWHVPQSYAEFHTQAQPLVWWSLTPVTPPRDMDSSQLR